MYEVSYQHEDFSVYISPINGDNYSSIKFNDNAMNAKTVEIGLLLIIMILLVSLEKKIFGRRLVLNMKNGYKKKGCGDDLDIESYLDKYIEELDSNYGRVDVSTDFLFYDDL